MNKNKNLINALLIIIMILVVIGCIVSYLYFVQVENEENPNILFSTENYPKVDGSIATLKMAENFKSKFTGQNIENVNIMHTKTENAYKNLINKKVDLILVTYPTEKEIVQAQEAGIELEIVPIAKEALVFFNSKENKVENLTLAQIQDIYSGKITNWRDVGGDDIAIIPYQRPSTSDSQKGMLSLVMQGIKMKETDTEDISMWQLSNIIVDYTNSKDCFPGISVSGGVCYFLWNRDKESDCEFINITNNSEDAITRPLNEFQTLVRYNKAVSIIHKIQKKKEDLLAEMISSLMPYGLSTSYRGHSSPQGKNNLALYASNGVTYIDRQEISKGYETVDSFKLLVSKTSAEHAGEPGKDGRFKVIPSSMKVLHPGEVCTHSYFIIGNWEDSQTAENALSYMRTKFVRFLMLLCISGFGLSKIVFQFVPVQDFSKPWTDAELYEKYGLTEEEITFIESMIKPMELGGDDDGN